MVLTPKSQQIKVSRIEHIKERSNFLREPLAAELQLNTTHFTEDAVQILKFQAPISKIIEITVLKVKRKTTK